LIANPHGFWGVLCTRCGDPIPVSERIVEIHDEIARGRTGIPYAFLARCKMCEYESIYEITKVERFGGEPRKRIRRKRAA
jgi:hypothetical protein